MTLFNRLRDATANVVTLERFITNNAEELHDWFSLEPHSFIKGHQKEIRDFTLLKWNVIRRLDLENTTNLTFVALLLDVCERLGDSNCFQKYHELLRTTEFDIGSRLKAAVLFMVGISKDVDYIDRFDSIYTLLEIAYQEEDSQDRVLTTMINYYSLVVSNFGQFNKKIVNQLKNKIEQAIKKDEYSFLSHPIIFNVLEVGLSDYKIAYYQIHVILDSYLDREVHHPEAETGLIKEADTDYALELSDKPCEFLPIRNISVRKHQANPLQDEAYNSLLHGIKIVEDESLLHAYMYAFGKMHAEKLSSSFPFLPLADLDSPIAVVDWGCGQGTGSMVLLDHILHNDLDLDIHSFTLIEPSVIALKRASLHTDKYNNTTRLITLNKLINDLVPEDFVIKEHTFVHIFSNMLDIDAISLKSLTDLIKTTFQGVNYFICVGPYQNDQKRGRFDSFMNSFIDFNLVKLAEKNDRAYQWLADKKWTRLLRIFKATI